MLLKEIIKAKICLSQLTPNYPLREFVSWAENQHIDSHDLLHYLDHIQTELDAETIAIQQYNIEQDLNAYQVLHCYWCMYCTQVRKYYRAILKNPHCKSALSFLLVSTLPDRPLR